MGNLGVLGGDLGDLGGNLGFWGQSAGIRNFGVKKGPEIANSEPQNSHLGRKTLV